MLHGDLDDEQSAHLAHEHSTDLGSSPSSSSSSVPPFYDARRRSKSTSHHRSHSTADGSTSSHLLVRLIAREEEVREINAVLAVTSERLESESSRANAAERRALDYFHRLRIATENRERAEQESARLREELKLYQLQLENAQKEIFRAQDIIDQVAAQRNEAESDAARARTKARKLQEEKLVMLAREEGRRVGYREGLSMGRRISYDQENYDADEDVEDQSDDERSDPRSRIQLRSAASMRQQPIRPESAPPVRALETGSPLPVPSRATPVPSRTPSRGSRTPSPDEPETIHPIPIRASPTTPTYHVTAPPDGWIPRTDSRASYIPVPPPRGLQPPVSHSLNSVPPDLQNRRPTPRPGSTPEPTPVPPPVRVRDYAYQAPVLPPVQRVHTPSFASRTSTHISQYDLVNKRPGSSLRNEIYAARAGSGSQPSRGSSSSQNEYREQDRRHSGRTEAEDIAEQWRADSDTPSPPPPPRNPPRSSTPGSVSHPRRPVQFYYQPREVMTPTPEDDETDPRPRTPKEPTQPPTDDPSHPAHARSQVEYLRQRFRKRPSSGGSGSIPNIIVESPSEPETAISPSATTAAQPELLSPEAANRPLPPQEDPGQRSHPPRPPSQAQSYSQSQAHHRHQYQQQQAPPPSSAYAPAYAYSGMSSVPWPPSGHVPYPSAPTPEPKPHPYSNPSGRSRLDSERDTDRRRSTPTPVPVPAPTVNPVPHPNLGRTAYGRSSSHPTPVPVPPSAVQGGLYARPRTQSATSGSSSSLYETAPVPTGVVYPAPPSRPHTSHTRYRDQERHRDGDRERIRDGARDWEDRDRDWDRDRERDRGLLDTGREEGLSRSPAPLARPISLFDSDEDRDR